MFKAKKQTLNAWCLSVYLVSQRIIGVKCAIQVTPCNTKHFKIGINLLTDFFKGESVLILLVLNCCKSI